MIDVSFSGCLGALHLPEGDNLPHGVILCPAFGYEGLCTQRALVALADDLAAHGMPALRFDYPDQGDSVDLPSDSDAVAAWLASIEAAAALMSEFFPGIAISLIGYRLGALLAAEAAERIPSLRSLVLVAPVLTGGAYLRELTLTTPNSRDPVTGAIEANGWRLSGASAANLAQLSLDHLKPAPGRDILLLGETRFRAIDRLIAAFAAMPGTEVEFYEGPDLQSLNQHAHHVTVPEPSFAKIAGWLAARPLEAGSSDRLPRHLPADFPPAAALELPCSRETPVHFGPGGGSFGIATQPNRVAPGAPFMLILNTGANPRSGHGRLGVRLARELARAGIPSLRIDTTGTGDTRPVLRSRNLLMYADARIEDVEYALDWISAAGGKSVVTCGLCSGAYLGLLGALTDERITGAILVNSQSFLWPKGKNLEEVIDVGLQDIDSYITRVRQPDIWLKLVRGRLRFWAVLKGMTEHYAAALGAALQSFLPASIPLAPRTLRIEQNFAALAARGVPLLLVYSAGDPGLNELNACFGRDGRRLRRKPTVSIKFIENADHTLTGAGAKQTLIEMVEQYIRSNFPAAKTAAGCRG